MFHQEDARKPSGTGKVGSEYSGISDTASSPKNEICSMSLSDSAGIKDSASSAHPMIAQVHRTKISDEITCSVCLDILVRPITLVPCGHTFCQPCWSTAKRTDCPECRVTVKCFVPARQIDNMVATLASVPNLLDDDDRQVYLERTELYRQAVVDSNRTKGNQQRKRRKRNHVSHASIGNATSFVQRHPLGYDPILALPPHVEIIGVPGGTTGSQSQGNSMVGRASRSSHAARALASLHAGSVEARSSTTNGHLPYQRLHPSDPVDYDPMLAPLPPPFEIFSFPAGGLTSIDETSWADRTSRPIHAAGASTSRHPRAITRSTSAGPSPTHGSLPRRQTHTTGDSVEEPICID